MDKIVFMIRVPKPNQIYKMYKANYFNNKKKVKTETYIDCFNFTKRFDI